MTDAYMTRGLYGGALLSELPTSFADVSEIRQVPDNQEVFIDKDGFTSIVFDITERVGSKGHGPEVDGRALTTHLEDIVGDDIDGVKVWSVTPTLFSRLDDNIPAYTLIATHSPTKEGSNSKSSAPAPDFTAIILTLVRLERQKTDVLITINVPHIKGEYNEAEVDLEMGHEGRLIGNAVEYAAKIWQTFRVKDWDLFGAV